MRVERRSVEPLPRARQRRRERALVERHAVTGFDADGQLAQLYRAGTPEPHVTAFCDRMRVVRGTVAGMQRLEIGRDELRDARSWDLVLIMEFTSMEALRAYQRDGRD